MVDFLHLKPRDSEGRDQCCPPIRVDKYSTNQYNQKGKSPRFAVRYVTPTPEIVVAIYLNLFSDN